MGWFDEQIRQRKQSDQEIFEDSMFRMASVVLGRSAVSAAADARVLTKAAIDDILKYYNIKPTEIPDTITDPDEQLEYCLRPHGLMRRNVKLEEGWYRDAFGPMLGLFGESRLPVALLPKPFMGYRFLDPVSGEWQSLNRQTAAQFDEDAICFYRPLPLKKLGIPDLLLYMKGCLSAGDVLMIAALTLLATLVGMLMPRITRTLTGTVLERGSLAMLTGAAVFTVCTIISMQLISSVRELMMNRIEVKTSLSVEAAVMMRVMNLPADFFRRYSSGELSSRFGAVNQLCSQLLGGVFSLGLSSLMSLLYITEIFHYAPALVLPALAIILLTVGVSVIAALLQIRISKPRVIRTAVKNDGAHQRDCLAAADEEQPGGHGAKRKE